MKSTATLTRLTRKPTPTFLLGCLLLAGLLSGPADRASAFGGSQSTRFSGIVQAIDYQNKTITFQAAADGKSLSLGWNWETSFFLDDKRVQAVALKPGTKVKVKYRSPLFGREYAAKVEWKSTPAGRPS